MVSWRLFGRLIFNHTKWFSKGLFSAYRGKERARNTKSKKEARTRRTRGRKEKQGKLSFGFGFQVVFLAYFLEILSLEGKPCFSKLIWIFLNFLYE